MNEVDGEVKAEFEKILERDHGVSREEDTELINGLWANLEEEDKSEAERLGKTGVQDLVDDARGTRLYKTYMAGKRGKVSIGSSETTTGYPEGLSRLEDELLGDGSKAADSELKATTRARVAALSEYLSRIVAADQAVVHFRARVLGDPTKTVPPDEATKLVRSLAVEQQPGPARDAETLWWSGSGDPTQAEPITVWPGSELFYLRNISSRLAKRYPWTEDQVCYLILTGQTIKAATISGRYSKIDTGVAAHRYYGATITLEIDHWMPSEYVRQAYHNVQHDLLGENNRQPERRNVEVFRFVVTRSKLQVVNREEGLAKLTIPTWKELREIWNEQYPEGHRWHYGKNREYRFSRDFYRGQEAVIGTRYGLPGVPGQPMSRAELQGLKERFIRPSKVTSRSTVTHGKENS